MSLASESCCHASEYSCRNWSFTSHGRGGPRISPRTARRCASVPRKQNPQPNDQCGQCYGSSDEQQSFLDPELISVYLRRVSGGIKLIHLSLVENARAGGGSIASRSCPFPDWAPPYPVWRIRAKLRYTVPQSTCIKTSPGGASLSSSRQPGTWC